MKRILKTGIFIVFFLGIFYPSFSQSVLMVEKIGTRNHFPYAPGDKIKLRTHNPDTILHGYVTAVLDSSLSLSLMSGKSFKHAKGKTEDEAQFLKKIYPVSLQYPNISFLYRNYGFPKRLSKGVGIAAAMYFVIITLDHMLNNEAVFTPDVFIVSGSCAAVSLISLSFSQQRIRIGDRWKLKVMNFQL